jgi:hypothetical protein
LRGARATPPWICPLASIGGEDPLGDPDIRVQRNHLVHHATIFEMNVESNRRRTALISYKSAALADL